MRDLMSSATQAALDLGEAAADAVVTIANRVSMLATHSLKPDSDCLSEWHGAGVEKVAAGLEGVWAAGAAWQDWVAEAFWAPLTPTGMAHRAVELVRVAAHPAQQRVRANADRLSRR